MTQFTITGVTMAGKMISSSPQTLWLLMLTWNDHHFLSLMNGNHRLWFRMRYHSWLLKVMKGLMLDHGDDLRFLEISHHTWSLTNPDLENGCIKLRVPKQWVSLVVEYIPSHGGLIDTDLSTVVYQSDLSLIETATAIFLVWYQQLTSYLTIDL